MRTWYNVIFLLFSLFCSFSAFCIHCYIVMFCYSTHYIILCVSFLVSLLKNTNLNRCFIILHPVFPTVKKFNTVVSFLFSTLYPTLIIFFEKIFGQFKIKLYLCIKVNQKRYVNMIYTKPQKNESANTWCVFDYKTGIVIVSNITWVDVCNFATKHGYNNREYDRQHNEIIFY